MKTKYSRFFVSTLLIMFGLLGLEVPLSAKQQQQQSEQPAMFAGDARHSWVFSTSAPERPPTEMVWKSEKLFELRRYYGFDRFAVGGGFEIIVDYFTYHYFSLPIVSGGIVLFTLNRSDAFFFALDAMTGKQLVTLKFDKNTLSFPAAIGKTAFFGTRSGHVYAYDLEKLAIKWSYSEKDSEFVLSPALDQGVVYFKGMRGLYAFVATTGELKWVFEVKYTGSPVIGGGRAILITSKGELLAVDTETGKLQWKVTIGRDFKWQAIMDDQIFVVHQSGEVRSYAMVDGALKWKSKVRSNTPLALFRELAIFSERPTDVVAIDVKTGVEKWRFKTKSMCVEPMIAGGTFFVTCRDKTLYSLEPVSGQEKWRYSSKEQLPLPTIADGKIYFLGSDGILAAVK